MEKILNNKNIIYYSKNHVRGRVVVVMAVVKVTFESNGERWATDTKSNATDCI